MREDDAAGIVDDGAQALGIESGRRIGRGGALTAIAGNQQPSVRHGGAELGKLIGIRGADHSSDRTVVQAAAILRADIFGGKLFDKIGNVTIQRLRTAIQVLKLTTARIGSFHQHKNATVVIAQQTQTAKDCRRLSRG